MTLDEAISLMTAEIVIILNKNEPSIFLYGSVTLGDFRPGWSDIDIIVLANHELSGDEADTERGRSDCPHGQRIRRRRWAVCLYQGARFA